MDLTKAYKKSIKAYNYFMSTKDVIAYHLSLKLDFEFAIEYAPGDGLVILDLKNNGHYELIKCIELFYTKEKITLEDLRPFML